MSRYSSHTNWVSPPEALDQQPHQVDVWRAYLLPLSDSLTEMEEALSSDEKQRASRFLRLVDKNRFIASHSVLRNILTRYLRCEPDQIHFSVNRYGKPSVRDHDLDFSLSHSGELAMVAVSQTHKVGVDVEHFRTGISSQVIARQFFSKAEFEDLEKLPLDQQEAAFFACWTRKEAYIKAHGLGLSLPLDSFDVSLLPGQPAVIRATRPDPEEAAHWSLLSLEIDSHYAAAVAAKGQDLEFRTWNWNTL